MSVQVVRVGINYDYKKLNTSVGFTYAQDTIIKDCDVKADIR